MQSRRNILKDLFIVSIVTILPLIIRSTYLCIFGTTSNSEAELSYSYFTSVTESLIGILLMFYVLNISEETYRDLGIIINLKEIFQGIYLFVISYIAYYFFSILLNIILPQSLIEKISSVSYTFSYTEISISLIAFFLINPFFEELIVRGFIMTRIKYLTNNKFWIIGVSVLLQFSYHLYQGFISAILLSVLFLIFAVYYFKTGRLTPVIIAHFIFDFMAMMRMLNVDLF